MLFQVIISGNHNTGYQLAAICYRRLPKLIQVKGYTKILILHKCSSYKRLWKKSHCSLVFCKSRYNLCMFRFIFDGDILLRI